MDTPIEPLKDFPLLDNFEEIMEITARKIFAGTLTSEDRVLLYRLALSIVGEAILTSHDLVTLIHPEVLAALHQLTLLADPSTTPETLHSFAAELEATDE